MEKEFKPIVMKCDQEQYEVIKPKLDNNPTKTNDPIRY